MCEPACGQASRTAKSAQLGGYAAWPWLVLPWEVRGYALVRTQRTRETMKHGSAHLNAENVTLKHYSDYSHSNLRTQHCSTLAISGLMD